MLSTLQIATGCGLLLFWAAFHTIGLAPAHPPAGYFVYEHSFTVPDCLLAFALIHAGRLNLQDDAPARSNGKVWSIATAGALVFLGALDVSFNLQNGMYRLSIMDTILSLAINAWCIGFGAWVIWKLRAGEARGE